MSKIYKKADQQTHEMVLGLLKSNHAAVYGLKDVDLVVLFVESTTDADALTHHGHPCLAKIKINTPLQIAIHGVNVVILLDHERYDQLSQPRKLALLDHELCHLEITPKGVLKLRPDDYLLTGFKACIERHGQDAMEVLALAQVQSDIGAVGMQHVFYWSSPEVVIAKISANKGAKKAIIDNKTGRKLHRLAKKHAKRKTGS